MTWGRFVIAMVEHAVEVGELYTAAVAKQERDDEALILAAEVEGRAVWRYLDDAEVAESVKFAGPVALTFVGRAVSTGRCPRPWSTWPGGGGRGRRGAQRRCRPITSTCQPRANRAH